MKRSMMRRMTLREIRSTMGRFLAILAIIGLGAGFFSGVRITTPEMVRTVDRFLKDREFYDLRLISTIGWEDEDVEAFREIADVKYAEGSNFLDVLCTGDEDTEFVFKTHSVPQQINLLEMTEGRLPEADDECVIDAGMMEATGLLVGGTVHVSDANDEDTLDALRFREFRIVGAAHSSYYLNFERGSTSIGDGTVSGYLYIPNEAFDRDFYTEVFVRFNGDEQIYSQPYKDKIKQYTAGWEKLAEIQAAERYDRVKADAAEKIADGKQELAEKRIEGQQELDDARKELGDGKRELDDAKRELDDAKTELDDAQQELDDAKQELDDALKELEEGEEKLADSKKQLDEAKQKLDDSEKQLKDGEQQLADGQKQLDAAWAELSSGEQQLSAGEQQLAAQEAELNAQLEQLRPMWDMLPEEQKAQLTAAQQQIAAAKEQLAAKRQELEAGRRTLEEQQRVADEKKQELSDGRAAFEKGKAEYEDGLRQYTDAEKKLADGRKQYEEGLAQYEDGLAEYEDGRKQYEDGLKEYRDGLKDYNKGKQEYEDGLKEYNEKIADAEQELADAEEELADLETPDTYVLDRMTNIGYSCFESDSSIVNQVARVFPLFFILVAALVCMTTMSRMVEEQRTQIGVLKALGYSEAAIMGKFLFYAGSAATIGCVAGYALGSFVFPTVIWMSYELMYIPLPLVHFVDWMLLLLALAASLLCSLGTTWITCRIELSETAASLMRPKAPKAGKRVLLEYVPFIWNRLKFLYKVSIRNIFRYKGRFFMMIVGISGCTALLLTGFGLRDSVAGFADVQYETIVVADAMAVFKSELKGDLPEELTGLLDEKTESYVLLHSASWDLVTPDKTKSISVIAPFDTETFDSYMHLRSRKDGTPLAFPGQDEAIVSNSVSERYNVRIGDTITLRDEYMHEMQVRVSGVFENYVYNYILLSPETMRSQLGEMPESNSAYLNFPEGSDPVQQAALISSNENITTMTVFQELKVRLTKMMGSLDYIVLLIIICAAGLAFVVLYNLTNINITERVREIATIKVLGFFRNETSAYVMRENVALTTIGIGLGLVLGVLLHRFVISQIIVDLVSFSVKLLPMSFVYSVILTLLFNLIVNLVMSRKLDRINMAESLKSVD